MNTRASEVTQSIRESPRLETRQVGWPLLVVASVGGAVLLFRAASGSSLGMPPWLAVSAGVMIAALVAVFSALTVRVWGDRVEWAFGLGWPRWSIPLSDIRAVDPVRYSSGWGVGIRRTRSGWLYNVSSQHAVRLKLLEGRVVSLGVDDARQFKRVIDEGRLQWSSPALRSAPEPGELTHRSLLQRLLD